MSYTMISLGWLIATLPFMIFSVLCLASELHMLQLNSYRNDRYRSWLKEKGKPRYMSLFGILAVVPLFLGGLIPEIVGMVLWVLFYLVFIQSRDKTPPKKPLVFTDRATRLYVMMLVLYFIPAVALLFLGVANVGASSLVRAICLGVMALQPILAPLFVFVSNAIMKPYEESKKEHLASEARAILGENSDLIRVGITGSYGKTSVKHALNRMLEEKYYTLMPPGSYNTPMGITKVIREDFRPVHQAFIAEMGAREKGDIKELCELVTPRYGIVTAIGEAHLDSFGDISSVIDTKFELVEALPTDGVAVLNFDDDNIRDNAGRMRGKVVSYGIKGENLDFWAENIRYHDRGMEFILHSSEGAAEEIRTRLLGIHNVYNIVGAAAMARQLGVSYKQIRRAVASLTPVEHRLELKTTTAGIHIIDDSFNSNPVGAAAAMELLAHIEGGKKFLVTPGMVELGDKEDEENKKFGAEAAAACDYIALVGEKQTAVLKEGILEAGFPEDRLFVASNLNDANTFIFGLIGKGDYLLYENDLPDTYNE